MEKYDKVVDTKGTEARVLEINFNPIRRIKFAKLAPQWFKDDLGAGQGKTRDFDLTEEFLKEWKVVQY